MNGSIVVIDASVVVALFRGEPEAPHLLERTLAYERRVISAATWFETSMVCEGKKDLGGGAWFDRIVAALGLEVVPFTARQAELARGAFKKYGKGREHPASLNFGDCFVYALAKDLDVPLLFKGDDFIHTDIEAA